MTFAQFKHMKPIYRRRLVIALAVAFALFIGALYAISFGVQALLVQANTTKIEEVTTSNVLGKASMAKILAAIKQEDSANVLVLGSELVFDGAGKLTTLSMELVNIVDKGCAEYWTLSSKAEKTTVRKTSTKYDNMEPLRQRKMEFKTYYPALSRLPADFLPQDSPAGEKGFYTLTDSFENNCDPEYAPYIAGGLTGVWVSRTSAITKPLTENFVMPTKCAPFLVTVEAVNTEKSKGKRVVLNDPAEKYVLLLEAGTYQ